MQPLLSKAKKLCSPLTVDTGAWLTSFSRLLSGDKSQWSMSLSQQQTTLCKRLLLRSCPNSLHFKYPIADYYIIFK